MRKDIPIFSFYGDGWLGLWSAYMFIYHIEEGGGRTSAEHYTIHSQVCVGSLLQKCEGSRRTEHPAGGRKAQEMIAPTQSSVMTRRDNEWSWDRLLSRPTVQSPPCTFTPPAFRLEFTHKILWHCHLWIGDSQTWVCSIEIWCEYAVKFLL